MRRFFTTLALLVLFSAHAALAASPVVIETMTSQGCGDAPPVENYLLQLHNADPDLIILNCHVTYFNKEGWEDSFSHQFCDKRHFSYFRELDLEQIRTPEIIVNGSTILNGQNSPSLPVLIEASRRTASLLPLAITKKDDHLTARLPAFTPRAPLEIWVMGYDNQAIVPMKVGPNTGLTLEHFNMVREIKNLGIWDGKDTLDIPLEDMKAQGYAVLLQEEEQGEIVAAGKL